MKRPLMGLVVIAAACASTPQSGVRVDPNEMSAAGHDEEAKREEETAVWHQERYVPAAAQAPAHDLCSVPQPSGLVYPCWSSTVNPTTWHLDEAARHYAHAKEHRDASQALRDAEVKACGSYSEEDRDVSPFHHCEDIVSIGALYSPETRARARQIIGATVVFRAVPGVTAAWLEGLLSCHLSRNAVLGGAVADMEDCPLALKGVKTQVTTTWNGFVVFVFADDPEVAHQIYKRASALGSCAPKNAVPGPRRNP